MTVMSDTTASIPTERRILRRAEVEAKTGFKRAHIVSIRPLPLPLDATGAGQADGA
ncbi:phage transcriptional regulator AlpA, partial [Salinisphaera hydrothermalis C41B8]